MGLGVRSKAEWQDVKGAQTLKGWRAWHPSPAGAFIKHDSGQKDRSAGWIWHLVPSLPPLTSVNPGAPGYQQPLGWEEAQARS